MKKKIVVTAPALTQSGYGIWSRQILDTLLKTDKYDCGLFSIDWGKCNYIHNILEKYGKEINRAGQFAQNNEKTDVHIHISIPPEFKRINNVVGKNIGVTAGLETDMVPPLWIQKVNEELDELVVISKHASDCFTNTKLINAQTKETIECNKKPKILNGYYEFPESILDEAINKDNEIWNLLNNKVKREKNLLYVAQFAPRKNFYQTLKIISKMDDVGLVIKTNGARNSYFDFYRIIDQLKNTLEDQYGIEVDKIKEKVVILHGEFSTEQLYYLYNYPKINAFLCTSHGEGFSYPMLEAGVCGLPVIAPNWSGHTDFLNLEKDSWIKVPVKLEYIASKSPECLVKSIYEEGIKWAYVEDEVFIEKIDNFYTNQYYWEKRAKELSKKIREQFNKNVIEKKIIDTFERIM